MTDPRENGRLFTDEIIKKMKKRVYWSIISGMFGICLVILIGLNAILMFFSILAIGFLNPYDRL